MVFGYESQFLAQLLPFFAQAAEGGGDDGGMLQFFLIMGLMLAGFYFLLIAPQRKKQKEHAQMVGNLKSGDEILTMGGIYGTVTNVKSDRVVVRISENTKIEVNRHSVQAVLPSGEKEESLRKE